MLTSLSAVCTQWGVTCQIEVTKSHKKRCTKFKVKA